MLKSILHYFLSCQHMVHNQVKSQFVANIWANIKRYFLKQQDNNKLIVNRVILRNIFAFETLNLQNSSSVLNELNFLF